MLLVVFFRHPMASHDPHERTRYRGRVRWSPACCEPRHELTEHPRDRLASPRGLRLGFPHEQIIHSQRQLRVHDVHYLILCTSCRSLSEISILKSSGPPLIFIPAAIGPSAAPGRYRRRRPGVRRTSIESGGFRADPCCRRKRCGTRRPEVGDSPAKVPLAPVCGRSAGFILSIRCRPVFFSRLPRRAPRTRRPDLGKRRCEWDRRRDPRCPESSPTSARR